MRTILIEAYGTAVDLLDLLTRERHHALIAGRKTDAVMLHDRAARCERLMAYIVRRSIRNIERAGRH